MEKKNEKNLQNTQTMELYSGLDGVDNGLNIHGPNEMEININLEAAKDIWNYGTIE